MFWIVDSRSVGMWDGRREGYVCFEIRSKGGRRAMKGGGLSGEWSNGKPAFVLV